MNFSFAKNRILLASFLIITPNVICLLFWVFDKPDLILNYQTGFNILLVPFFVCVFGTLKTEYNPVVIIISLLGIGIVGNSLNYIGWGIWSGGLLNPDTETIMIQMFAVQFQLYGALIAGLMQLIRYFIKKRVPNLQG